MLAVARVAKRLATGRHQALGSPDVHGSGNRSSGRWRLHVTQAGKRGDGFGAQAKGALVGIDLYQRRNPGRRFGRCLFLMPPLVGKPEQMLTCPTHLINVATPGASGAFVRRGKAARHHLFEQGLNRVALVLACRQSPKCIFDATRDRKARQHTRFALLDVIQPVENTLGFLDNQKVGRSGDRSLAVLSQLHPLFRGQRGDTLHDLFAHWSCSADDHGSIEACED